MIDKAVLKAAAVALLDTIAEEHPAGHQASKARRYVLAAPGGTALEVMFEQDEGSSAHLWVHRAAAGPLASRGEQKTASALWKKLGKDGRPSYGRHSGLRIMPQLAEADLVRFKLNSLAELGGVVDQLLAASAAGVSP